MNPWVALSFPAMLAIVPWSRCEEIVWRNSGPGVAMTRFTNSAPVIFTAVRVDLDRFKKDLRLATTLADNAVAGTSPLSEQVAELPREFGTPIAAMNADFFMMGGASKGDPRGLHIWRGELVSVPAGPAAFWQDSKDALHGEPVSSGLTVSWPGGGTNRAGLNEQLGTNPMVLFTPTMGQLSEDRPRTPTRSGGTRSFNGGFGGAGDIPRGGPIRPPGGREYVLEHTGNGPWLPLRIGHIYQTQVAGILDGFTNVPPGTMLMMLGSNLLTTVAEITNGTPVTITVATKPDLSGVQHGLGTGPMLVRDGKPYDLTARMSEQVHPRAAIGWNARHLFLAVADGRQKGISVGLQLSEMADFMIDLGSREAIDMDGGQSTTLMLNGKIINQQPSGRHDVANGIVILRKGPTEDDPADQ